MHNDNDKPENGDPSKTGAAPNPAGPHAKPELTNPDATPGAGSLPSGKEKQTGPDAGTG
jgi:hypothetical protein